MPDKRDPQQERAELLAALLKMKEDEQTVEPDAGKARGRDLQRLQLERLDEIAGYLKFFFWLIIISLAVGLLYAVFTLLT